MIEVKPIAVEDSLCLFQFIDSNKKWLEAFFPITVRENNNLKNSEEYIKNKVLQRELKQEFVFVIRELRKRDIKGLIILKEIIWDIRRAEVAYCIARKVTNRGWTTMALNKILYFAFESLKLNIIEAQIHNSNYASIRVVQKCGFEWKHTLKKSYQNAQQEYLDMELYEKANKR